MRSERREEPKAGPSPAPGPDAGWRAASATQIGWVHRRDQTPAQDAHRSWSDRGCAVVAVADGHGHHLHFRSEVGSELAVGIASELLTPIVAGFRDAGEVRALLADRIGPMLVEAWIAAALGHLRAHPFSAVEESLVFGSHETDLLRPYGSTVIAMAASPRVLGVLQLGDGDAVVATGDGEVRRPLPEDADLDGVRTTSLCQPDPLRSLRTTALDVAADDLVLGFISTDGFGGPREDPETWWVAVGQQLVDHLQARGFDWIVERMPGWLQEPAEVGGDDTTLGLLLRLGPPA